jgi:hypothetical protein
MNLVPIDIYQMSRVAGERAEESKSSEGSLLVYSSQADAPSFEGVLLHDRRRQSHDFGWNM